MGSLCRDIENKCEGMIRIRDIKEDYFTFDPELYALVGDKTRKKYQLGDVIKIKVKSRPYKKTIRFYFKLKKMKSIIHTIYIIQLFLFSQSPITRTLGEFKEIKVYDLINVDLIKSSENRITISGKYAEDVNVIQKTTH